MPPGTRTSGLGIASLILGIVGLVIGLTPCVGWIVGIPLGVIGLILGLIGLAGGPTVGKGLPVTGTILSVLACVLSWFATHIWIMIGIVAAANVAGQLDAEAKKQIEERQSKAKVATLVTATELLKAYKDDDKKADEKYKGKWVRVKGKVEETPLLGPVTLKADSKDVSGAVKITPYPALLKKFTDLKKGDEVTIGGRCEGKSGSDVLIDDAVLME